MVTFVPTPIAQRQIAQGGNTLAQALQGQRSTSSLSPLASLAQGFLGGFQQGQGRAALAGNAQLQQDAQRKALEIAQAGGSGADISAALAGGTPQQGTQALNFLLADRKSRTVTPTALQRNLTAAGIDPNSPQGRSLLVSSLKRGTTVNLPGAKEFDKLLAKRVMKAQDDAATAGAAIVDLDVLEQTLSNPDVFTGAFGEGVNALKQFGSTVLGLNLAGVADAEVADRVSKRFALRLKKDLPGSMSNADRQFLVRLPPGLSVSPEGNRRLITIERIKQNAKIRRAEMLQGAFDPETGQPDRSVLKRLTALDKQVAGEISGQISQLRTISKQAKRRSPLAGVPIETMSLRQLGGLNPADLSEEELAKAAAREEALRGG